MDQTGKQRGAAYDLRRRHLRIARLHASPNGIEHCLIDDRRNRDGDDLLVGLVVAVLGTTVEFVPPDTTVNQDWIIDFPQA